MKIKSHVFNHEHVLYKREQPRVTHSQLPEKNVLAGIISFSFQTTMRILQSWCLTLCFLFKKMFFVSF